MLSEIANEEFLLKMYGRVTRDSGQQQNNQASSLGKDFFFISVVLCMRTNNLTTQYSSYCCLLYVRLSVDHQCYYYYMMMLHNFPFLSPWACMLISLPSRFLSITSLSAILVNNGCYCYRYLVKETILDLYAANCSIIMCHAANGITSRTKLLGNLVVMTNITHE